MYNGPAAQQLITHLKNTSQSSRRLQRGPHHCQKGSPRSQLLLENTLHFPVWHLSLVIGVQGGGRGMGLWAAINNQGTEILKVGQVLHYRSRPREGMSYYSSLRVRESLELPLLENLIIKKKKDIELCVSPSTALPNSSH